MRIVRVPERKLLSVPSGGLGVTDREGMGVTEREPFPFSFESFEDSASVHSQLLLAGPLGR